MLLSFPLASSTDSISRFHVWSRVKMKTASYEDTESEIAVSLVSLLA